MWFSWQLYCFIELISFDVLVSDSKCSCVCAWNREDKCGNKHLWQHVNVCCVVHTLLYAFVAVNVCLCEITVSQDCLLSVQRFGFCHKMCCCFHLTANSNSAPACSGWWKSAKCSRCMTIYLHIRSVIFRKIYSESKLFCYVQTIDWLFSIFLRISVHFIPASNAYVIPYDSFVCFEKKSNFFRLRVWE